MVLGPRVSVLKRPDFRQRASQTSCGADFLRAHLIIAACGTLRCSANGYAFGLQMRRSTEQTSAHFFYGVL